MLLGLRCSWPSDVSHTRANLPEEKLSDTSRARAMPTLFRFIVIAGALGAAGYWGLFVLATRFEPQPQESVQQIGTVKIRKQ